MLEQPVTEGLTPWKGIHFGAVHELQPMGRDHTGEVYGGLSPLEGTSG